MRCTPGRGVVKLMHISKIVAKRNVVRLTISERLRSYFGDNGCKVNVDIPSHLVSIPNTLAL